MKNILKYPLIVAILGIVVFAVLYLSLQAFAGFGETIIYVSMLVALFIAFDKYILTDIDTITELKKGNIAYAIFMLAIAVLFLAVAVLVG